MSAAWPRDMSREGSMSMPLYSRLSGGSVTLSNYSQSESRATITVLSLSSHSLA